MKAINDPDVTNNDQAYWERVLRSHGLPAVSEDLTSLKPDELGGKPAYDEEVASE